MWICTHKLVTAVAIFLKYELLLHCCCSWCTVQWLWSMFKNGDKEHSVLNCLTTKWIMHLLFITNFTNRLFWLLIEFHSNLEGVGNHMLHVLWCMYYKPTYRGHVKRLILFYFMDNVLVYIFKFTSARYELGLSAILSALSITQKQQSPMYCKNGRHSLITEVLIAFV